MKRIGMFERAEVDKPLRVLHVLNGMHAGGIQSFLVSLHQEIDPGIIQFDYLVRYEDVGVYEPIVHRLGGRVFHVPHSTKHPIRAKRDLRSFFEANPYQIAHFHYGFLQDMTPISAAKRFGVSTRIMHAHSANYQWKGMRERLFQAQHEINKIRGASLATERFACSAAAAKWFAFEGAAENGQWRFVPNGVKVDELVFDREARKNIRELLDISPNSLCLGNVGRLSITKNQFFLLEVFRHVLDMGQEADLIIVGGGELEGRLKRRAAQLGISRNVHFVGETAGAAKFYNGMDVFVFPSKAEGLGMALVEAQANGLPCVTSDSVPREAIICSTTEAISLNQSVREWAEAVVKLKNFERNSRGAALVRAAGYDVKEVASALTEFYCSSAIRAEGESQYGK